MPCGPLVAALSRVSVAGRLVPATRLVRTTDDHAALLARLGFEMVRLPHGAQKAFGWFRDDSFQARINAMTDHGWLAGGRSGVRRLAELLGRSGYSSVSSDAWSPPVSLA